MPDTTPPRNQIYPPSLPEQQAMEEYIPEALYQYDNQPSTSHQQDAFFLLWGDKKEEASNHVLINEDQIKLT